VQTISEQRIIIFGNSGSGKSTLAVDYKINHGLNHLDLDSLAWENTVPPSRMAVDKSLKKINLFLDNNKNWIIEGCYADLLSTVIQKATNIIFLNPGVETCIYNCKNRPWEPHKYESAQKQNENLEMLLDWVKQYPVRTDEFSLKSHQALFNAFDGDKIEYNSNTR